MDFCRALATAVLGNPETVTFIEVNSKTRFTSLTERKTDAVMYSSTWTLGRESTYGISFPAIYLFDGQGLMVRHQSNIKSLTDLNGKSVCVTENTTTHTTIRNVIERNRLNTKIVFANGDAFFRGNCDAYTADRINLATNRASRADRTDRYDILPLTLSREPIGPMIRNDDPQWDRIVRSVVHALILAEEAGITQMNVEEIRRVGNSPEVENLLGANAQIGHMLGLDPEWAFRAIKAVGNYGEVFNRHFGPNTPIGMDRGPNRPWSEGGLLYAPLFR